mmetsp:Transcript_8099/g.17118  ORF Transcript_8099/g.17118 Transcript_8099/m.17118 type:complete len:81 (+) Transcript_8099:698-940(+)
MKKYCIITMMQVPKISVPNNRDSSWNRLEFHMSEQFGRWKLEEVEDHSRRYDEDHWRIIESKIVGSKFFLKMGSNEDPQD